MISDEGVYDLSASAYHADPCETPSCNRSIGRLFVEATPAHAYAAHPRLGGRPSAAASPIMDIGSAIHAVLSGDGTVTVIDAPDRRKKATRLAIDEARAEGATPVMSADFPAVLGAANALRKALGNRIINGKWEQSLIWREGDHWFRARPDFICVGDGGAVIDIKTTAEYAAPGKWSRHIAAEYGDMQAAMITAARVKLGLGAGPYLLAVVEQQPPHGVCIVEQDPSLVEFGRERWEFARDCWSRCMQSGEWPGYPPVPFMAGVSATEEYRWAERKSWAAAYEWLYGGDTDWLEGGA